MFTKDQQVFYEEECGVELGRVFGDFCGSCGEREDAVGERFLGESLEDRFFDAAIASLVKTGKTFCPCFSQ